MPSKGAKIRMMAKDISSSAKNMLSNCLISTKVILNNVTEMECRRKEELQTLTEVVQFLKLNKLLSKLAKYNSSVNQVLYTDLESEMKMWNIKVGRKPLTSIRSSSLLQSYFTPNA